MAKLEELERPGELHDVRGVATVTAEAPAPAADGTSPQGTSPLSSVLPPPVELLRKHDLQDHCFLKPSWCDVCAGILIGNGFQCMGGCGLKCHRGVGKHTFNCHASLLSLPCDHSVAPKETGCFKFSDVARQLGREFKTKVNETVVVQSLKEQRKLGNVDKIKELSAEVRRRWDEGRAKRDIVVAQLASIVVVHCLTYLLTLCIVGPLHGARGWRLASLVAAQSVNTLLFIEGFLACLVLFLARQAERYSALIHAFTVEIFYIDIHDLDIDFLLTGAAVERLMTRSLKSTGVLASISLAIWVRELVLAGFGT